MTGDYGECDSLRQEDLGPASRSYANSDPLHHVQIRRRIAVTTARPGVVFWLVVLGTLLVDQLSKYLVRANSHPGEMIALIPGLLGITYVRNIGGAFGVLAGYRMLFIGVMILVVAGVAIYWYRTRPRYVWLCVSLGLVTAGALGNAIDRMDTGLVTDFIDVLDKYWPIFNVADSAVVIGVGMLLIWIILAPEERRAPDIEDPPADAEVPPTEVEHG